MINCNSPTNGVARRNQKLTSSKLSDWPFCLINLEREPLTGTYSLAHEKLIDNLEQ